MDSETETSVIALSDVMVLNEAEARLENEGFSSETEVVVCPRETGTVSDGTSDVSPDEVSGLEVLLIGAGYVVDEGTSSVDSTMFVGVIVVLRTFVVVIVNVVTPEFSENDVDTMTSESDLV
jgi:hypothetical protein